MSGQVNEHVFSTPFAISRVTPTTVCDRTEAKSQITVSFIIPALNEERLIANCLGSINAISLPDQVASVEVIVVDNHSVDRTVEISREHKATVIHCPPGNPARARNAGAALASGDWLAFVDADCCLDRAWLQQTLPPMMAADVVATGSQIAPPTDTDNWVVQTLGDFTTADTSGHTTPVRWLPTAGLLVKSKAFNAIGGFNEKLVTCEDCDLGYRLSTHGRLLFNPSATLIHHGESTTLRELLWREAWRTRGNLRLAFSRPADIVNWLSLLLPVVFVALICAGLIGILVAGFSQRSLMPGFAMLLAGGTIPVLLVLRKLGGSTSAPALMRRLIVMTTFLIGRTIGLVLRCPRVER